MLSSDLFTGTIVGHNANILYRNLLTTLLMAEHRTDVAPRGQKLRGEIAGLQLRLTDPLYSVITVPERRLNYAFMVAEAVWIMGGRNDTNMIGHYCKDITNFSDDGKTFFGAYGPPLMEQLAYVIGCLARDPDSRQAVLTLWRQNPPVSKDIPCTVVMQFLKRQGKLHLLVTMRSSDAWLGIPYDVFNFSLVLNAMAGVLGCELGSLQLNLGSAHLYERNVKAAEDLRHKITYDYNYNSGDKTRILVPRLPGWLPEEFTTSWEPQARLDGTVVKEAPRPWADLLEVLATRLAPHKPLTGAFKDLPR